MSDTPRTDDAWKTMHTMYELAGEMKRMERELNAANDRIKRLEEAGDAMELVLRMIWKDASPCTYKDSNNKMIAWRKAKEAKP